MKSRIICTNDGNASIFTPESDNSLVLIELSINDGQTQSRFKCKQVLSSDKAFELNFEDDQYGKLRLFLHEQDSNDYLAYNYELAFEPSISLAALIQIKFLFESKSNSKPFFMIPGVLYGTNNLANSKGQQVQFNYHGDIGWPKTSVYLTRADRSSHRAVLSISDARVFGVCIDEASYDSSGTFVQYNGLGLDCSNYDAYDRIVMSLGYQHFPKKYHGNVSPSVSEEAQFSSADWQAGQSYKVGGYIYLKPQVPKEDSGLWPAIFGYEDCLRAIYQNIHQAPHNTGSYQEAVGDLAKALIASYNRTYHLFPVVHGNTNFSEDFGVNAWTGGMQVAYPLLKSSPYVEGAREIALDFIHELITNGLHQTSGLFYEAKQADTWQTMGWWKGKLRYYTKAGQAIDEFFSAYVNGQASCYLLKSYRFIIADPNSDSKSKETVALCLAQVRALLDGVISKRRFDGAFGVYFGLDGSVLSYNGFQGVWFLAALAELYAITKESQYKEAFEQSADYYHRVFQTLELWGTPIDANDAVDEEGNLAYITALTTYHRISNDERILDRLVRAINYEFTWKFAYNTRHQNEPLKSLNWASSGGSLTSSHNMHIHQMGNLISEELDYAYQITKDAYILSRLKDTLNWGLGTHNRFDGEFGFGKKGWASEQFYHTDGVQNTHEHLEDGGIWPVYLPWAASCVLLSACYALSLSSTS